jgi:protein subunit release factor A
MITNCTYKDGMVRITHLPTGMVTECDMSRSRVRNKAMAMQMMRSKLWAITNNTGPVESEIRSYTDADFDRTDFVRT